MRRLRFVAAVAARRVPILMLVASALAASGVAVAQPAVAASGATARPGRVLIISLPGATWEDVRAPYLPNLRSVLADSATGSIIVRTASGIGQPGDGYVTLGAGTRSGTDHATDGQGFDTTEPFDATTAGNAFAARTGKHTSEGLVHLGIAQILATNRSLLFGARPGALGDTLAGGGYARAVVANDDQAQLEVSRSGPPVPTTGSRRAYGFRWDRARRYRRTRAARG